jgi:DNA-binding transcriptional ArsR family regulator
MTVIFWDEGTAYDLFVSLYVLHRPTMFGVRPSWAAGVRSRLPAPQRDFLEKVQSFLPVPLSWLYLLPAEAKNSAGALNALAQIPASERLPSLLYTADTPIEAINTLREIALRQTWTSAEQEVLRAALSRRGITHRSNTLNNVCETWSDLKTSGEQYLQALNTYYQVFFREEEERICPILQTALKQAQMLALSMEIPPLLEQLSRGVHFEQIEEARQVVLVPSYWAGPLVFYDRMPSDRLPSERLPNERMLILFGTQSEMHDITPGETLPQDLVDTMKAIADPTRMRILRYLSSGPQTPSELARRLRLRPPTVIHHLNALRLAGLVEINLPTEGERGYELRREAINEALSLLIEFITPEVE